MQSSWLFTRREGLELRITQHKSVTNYYRFIMNIIIMTNDDKFAKPIHPTQ